MTVVRFPGRCLDLEVDLPDPYRDEKVPDTEVDRVVVAGVEVTSRWSKRAELLQMVDTLLRLRREDLRMMRTFWSDSKSGGFVVEVDPRWDDPLITQPLARRLSEAMVGAGYIHNSIAVGTDGWMDADWPEEDGDV